MSEHSDNDVEHSGQEQVVAIANNKIINTMLNCEIQYVVDIANDIWFKGKDIATALAYSDTDQAIRVNVDSDDKVKFGDISLPVSDTGSIMHHHSTIFINESGLYSLILSSKKAEAKAFKKWITKVVIPSIRQTGSYNSTSEIVAKRLYHNQFKMLNEYDLHTKVIEFIREYIPNLIVVPGLGELQGDARLRHMCYKKGYRGGQPDILILNKHRDYNGMAIELKTPKGDNKLSETQATFLEDLRRNNYFVLVSDKYEEVIMALTDYKAGLTIFDEDSGRHFKNKGQLTKYRRLKAQQHADSSDEEDMVNMIVSSNVK